MTVWGELRPLISRAQASLEEMKLAFFFQHPHESIRVPELAHNQTFGLIKIRSRPEDLEGITGFGIEFKIPALCRCLRSSVVKRFIELHVARERQEHERNQRDHVIEDDKFPNPVRPTFNTFSGNGKTQTGG